MLKQVLYDDNQLFDSLLKIKKCTFLLYFCNGFYITLLSHSYAELTYLMLTKKH